MLFMARLLSPKDYGTIGLLSVFLVITHLLITSGFGLGLIQKQDRTQVDLSTVFFFNIIVSFGCYILLFIIAPYVGDFYNIPELTLILRVLGISQVIEAFNAVQISILNYTMNFKTQAKISIFEAVSGGITGLVLAFCGFGVWALVWQSLTSKIIGCIMYWTHSQWRPTMVFSMKSFKHFFNYGYKLVISGLIEAMYDNIYPMIVGKFFAPDVLGHSSRASHWASFPSTNLVIMLHNVSFSSLSKIQDDNKRLCDIYRRMLKTTSFIVFPTMFGLSAIAVPLVYVVIGPKWDLCAQILQIISFTFMIAPIHSLNRNLLLVKGRSDLSLKLSIIEKILGATLLLSAIPFGVFALFYAGLIASIIMLFLNTYYTGKLINLGLWKQIKDMLPPFVICIVMFVFIQLALLSFSNIYIKLLLGIIVGATVYVGLSYISKIKELQEVYYIYKEFRGKNK